MREGMGGWMDGWMGGGVNENEYRWVNGWMDG